MNNLIDRNDLVDGLKRISVQAEGDPGVVKAVTDTAQAIMTAVFQHVQSAPAVDAVPVVRCKDCKYSRMYCFGCSDEPVLACCEIEEDDDGNEFIRAASSVEPDGYCSKGKNKKGVQTDG